MLQAAATAQPRRAKKAHKTWFVAFSAPDFYALMAAPELPAVQLWGIEQCAKAPFCSLS
jgi:hypothetical protein